MRVERTITSSFRKAVLLGLVSLCSTLLPVLNSLLLAEEPLFRIIAANRSAKLPTAPRRGIKSSQQVKLSSSASLKNFSVEINGQKVLGKQDTEAADGLMRGRRLSTSSEHGTLFSLDGNEIGNFISTTKGSSSHTFFLSEVGQAALTVNANEATWVEYDSSSMPGCGHDEHDFTEELDHSVKSFKSYDDVSITSSVTIDIMLLYTETAASKKGVDALLAELETAVELANLAFSNSQVPAQYRVVHTAEVPDTYEQDMALALGELRADPEVAALREKFGADLVSLIVGGDSHKYCGLGYVPYTPETVFKADNGFSVVLDSCAA